MAHPSSIVAVGGLATAALVAASAVPAAAQGITIERLVIQRSAARKDQRGNDLPPFTRARLARLDLPVRWRTGSRVTVVPLTSALPAFATTVAAVAAIPEGQVCDPEQQRFRVTFGPVRLRAVLRHRPLRERSGRAAPIHVAVVYPATPKARYLAPRSITAGDIPASFIRDQVTGALDLDGDGRPDALFLHYCRKDGRPQPGATDRCDDTASEIKLRRGGTWVRHRLYEPC
jgi:hypothetical protein